MVQLDAGTDYVLFGAQADLNGNDLVIDTDGDSYLHAAADDDIELVIPAAGRFDISIGGADELSIQDGTIVTGARMYIMPGHGTPLTTDYDLITSHTTNVGQKFWGRVGTFSSASDVIPSGTGDVADLIRFTSLVVDSVSGTTEVTNATVVVPGNGPNSQNIYDDATYVLTLYLTSAGQCYVQQSSGATRTFKVNIYMAWI